MTEEMGQVPEDGSVVDGVADEIDTMLGIEPVSSQTNIPDIPEGLSAEQEEELVKKLEDPDAAGAGQKEVAEALGDSEPGEGAQGSGAKEGAEEKAEAPEEAEAEGTGAEGADLSEVELLREQTATLMKLLNDSSPLASGQAVALPPTPLGNATQLDEETFDLMMRDPKVFQDYIMTVVGQARQQVLQEVQVVTSNLMETRSRVQAFYSSEVNKDLLPLMDYVNSEALKLEAQNPNLGVEEVLIQAANSVRARVGLARAHTVPMRNAQAPARRPAFAGGTSRRGPARAARPTAQDELADEIERMANI